MSYFTFTRIFSRAFVIFALAIVSNFSIAETIYAPMPEPVMAPDGSGPYLPGWNCTIDACPKSKFDRQVAQCTITQTEPVVDCILRLGGRKPSALFLATLLDNLGQNWLFRPWGPKLLELIFPLLQVEDDRIRSFNELWHRLDVARLNAEQEHSRVVLQLQGKKLVQRVEEPRVAPGNVQVHSTYNSVEEVGTGNLLHAPSIRPDTTLVLTAAHLIGGENLGVRIGDREVPILGWVADNDLDIAILEIPKQEIAAIEYQPQKDRLLISPPLEYTFYRETAPHAWLGANWNKSFSRVEIELVFFVNPWAEAGIEPYQKPEKTEDRVVFAPIGLSYDQRRYIVRARVTGGTSGSVVFQPNRVPVVEGMITQSNYYFGETRLIRSRYLLEVLKKYAQGQRGFLSEARWKTKNDLVYREFDQGWSEANFVQGEVGRGIYADPGRGVFADPGKQLWNSNRPGEVFKHYKIAPGMQYQGRSIVGIYARSKYWGRRNLLLYADSIALEFMKDHASEYDFDFIPLGSKDLLKFSSKRWSRDESTVNSFKALSGAPDVMITNRLLWKFTEKKNEISLSASGARVNLHVFSDPLLSANGIDAGEQAQFTIDPDGGVNGQPFLPIIEVKGTQSGEIYVVDIRKIIFDDLSQIMISPLMNSPTEIWQEYQRQLNLITLRARHLNSGLEFGYTFR